MTEKKLESWAVAAAVLHKEGTMHIEDLADKVVHSGLSTLGLRGKTPPRQTLSSQINSGKHKSEFIADGCGWYRLARPVEVTRLAEVEFAVKKYAERKNNRSRDTSPVQEVEMLRRENSRLVDENAKLRERLSTISALCAAPQSGNVGT